MSSLTTFVNCPNLQDQLEAVYCDGGKSENLPLVGFLFSAENNASLLEMKMIGDASIRTVQLVYSRRVLESEVDNYINYDTCTAPQKRGETSTTYTFDETKGLEIARKFDFADLWRRCESNELYFARLISELIDGAERKMETQAAAYLVAGVGDFATIDTDGVTADVKTVATKLSGGAIDYDAHDMIMQSARFNDFCSAPIIAGDYDIVSYYNAIGVGCCATTGIDFSSVAQGIPTILPSWRIGSAFADTSKFIVMEAGAALPVWFTQYSGGLGAALSSETAQFTTVVSRRGIPFDVSIIRDTGSSCNTVHVKVSLAWDLFFKPTDMYETSDVLYGVNGILTFDVSNP